MHIKPTLKETTAEDDLDMEEYLVREAQLLSELKFGKLCNEDYQRLKAEAWEVYQARSGRLIVDDDEPGSAPPQFPG